MPTNPTALRVDTAGDGSRVTARFPADTALTESNADELYRALSASVEGRECPHLVVDLSGVTVLTSAILSKFLALNKRLRDAGGQLALHNPTPSVHAVFKVTRLETVLNVRAGPPEVPA